MQPLSGTDFKLIEPLGSMDFRLPSARKSISASVASSDSADSVEGVAPLKQARTLSVESSGSMATAYLCTRSAAAAPAISRNATATAARALVQSNTPGTDRRIVTPIRKGPPAPCYPGILHRWRAPTELLLLERLRREFGVRLVRKIGRQPALDFLQAHAFAPRIILDLIAIDLRHGEVLGSGVGEIKTTDCGRRQHRE